ncbi:hypothetical protein [Mesobacterium pallidum]|uniref:hypothetical protein n=1 Tax=Mesobacterium pallidum TaxID=2872037 RepID=UPI001EE1F5F8|nr:hypothetical protein [Mesobacterium pallidum]
MTATRDLAALAAPDVVATLRHLALDVLAQALSGHPPRIDAGALAPLQPHLARADQAGALARSAARRARGNFVLDRPAEWSPYQMSLLPAEALVPPLRRGMARLVDRVVPRPAPTEAPHLLPALGASAWAALGFRRAVAALLRRDLRQRVLLSPPLPAGLVLDDAIWWHLLASAEAPDGLRPACTEIAAARAAAPGWAGFWDQALLHDLRRALGAPPGPLGTLPLVRLGPAALTADPATDPVTTRAHWRAEAPAWALHYLEGRI